MSDQLKVAVCDDEPRALTIVTSAVTALFADMDVEIAMESFMSPLELLERLESRAFDLLFLDISMPHMDGIELGKAVEKMGSTADIIFISSRMDRMFDTFAVEPVGFIRKNHFMEDLNSVLTRYVEKRKKGHKGDPVLFKDGKGTMSIDIERVKYIECVRNTQILYLDGDAKERKIHSRMEVLENELLPHNFIRVHKGYLVNCKYIRGFDAKWVELTTGEEISVSRSYSQSAKNEYLSYINRSGTTFI